MTTITIPRETFDAMREALEVLNNLDADINFLNTNELEEMVDKALAAAKAVSEDKRQSVTITSVKMVGGVAPEAELMRQATEQLEGMGFRVEHPKAVSEPKVKLIPTAEDMGAPKLGVAVAELASPEYDQLRAKVQFVVGGPHVREKMLKDQIRVYGPLSAAVRSDIDIHLAHCFQPPYDTSCKYGDDDCPATPKAVQPQAQGEAVAFLCDGTRFKVRQNEGDEAARIYGLPSDLNGRWVALVAADDDCHLKMTHPQASEPAWMPIETAPKDGSEVLMGNQDGSMTVGFYNKKSKVWCGDCPCSWATHWIPLPAAPEATK